MSTLQAVLDLGIPFEQEDALLDPEYCKYISKLDAIHLVSQAIQPDENDIGLVIEDYCDTHHLYGEARNDVFTVVMKEYNWISDFFYGDSACGPPGQM